MSEQRHVIGKVTLDLNVKGQGKADAFDLERRVMAYFYDYLLPELERLFDGMVEEIETISLDRLEINLDHRSVQNWEDELTAQLRSLVQQGIVAKLAAPPPGEVAIKQPTSFSRFDAWCHFLEHGAFLGEAATVPEDEMEVAVLAAVAMQSFAVERFKSLIINDKNALQRLMLQSRPAFLRSLSEAVWGQKLASLWAAAVVGSHTILAFFEAIKGKPLPVAGMRLRPFATQEGVVFYEAKSVWQACLSNDGNAVPWQIFDALLANMVTQLDRPALAVALERWLRNEENSKTLAEGVALWPWLERFAERASDDRPQRPSFESHEPPKSESIKTDIGTSTGGEHVNRVTAKADFTEKTTPTVAAAKAEPAAHLENRQEKTETGPTTEASKLDWEQSGKVPQMIENQSDVARSPLAGKATSADPVILFRTPANKQSWYVQNAGAVLMYPFLSHFFKAVGCVDGDNKFVDAAQHERAVHLLHFLATGQEQTLEHELLFPKFLCGYDLESPIGRQVVLDAKQKEEAQGMLQAIITHWGKLGNATPDGLRANFLMRPGKLSYDPHEGWLLQIEQQAWDLLLGHLPWGIGVVRLPWMPAMLLVEWNY